MHVDRRQSLTEQGRTKSRLRWNVMYRHPARRRAGSSSWIIAANTKSAVPRNGALATRGRPTPTTGVWRSKARGAFPLTPSSERLYPTTTRSWTAAEFSQSPPRLSGTRPPLVRKRPFFVLESNISMRFIEHQAGAESHRSPRTRIQGTSPSCRRRRIQHVGTVVGSDRNVHETVPCHRRCLQADRPDASGVMSSPTMGAIGSEVFGGASDLFRQDFLRHVPNQWRTDRRHAWKPEHGAGPDSPHSENRDAPLRRSCLQRGSPGPGITGALSEGFDVTVSACLRRQTWDPSTFCGLRRDRTLDPPLQCGQCFVGAAERRTARMGRLALTELHSIATSQRFGDHTRRNRRLAIWQALIPNNQKPRNLKDSGV